MALLASFGGQAAAGCSAPLMIDGPLWAWHQVPMAHALWGGPLPAEVVPYRAFAMAMLGPTMASAAALALFVVAGPFARGERWAWWALLASMVVWYPVDTVVSASLGVWVNVALNTGVLLSVLLPLVWSAPAFFRPRRADG